MRYLSVYVNGELAACLQVDRGTTHSDARVKEIILRHRRDRVRLAALDPSEDRERDEHELDV